MAVNFFAGEKLRASDLTNAFGQVAQVVARGVRTTTSANATSSTDVAVLRISNIQLTNGLEYRICTNSISPNSSVSGDTIRVQIHYNTTGANASVSDPVLPGAQAFTLVTAATGALVLECEYIPGANQTLSILLAHNRNSGSGNCNLFADGTRTIELKVYSLGTSVSDTGTGNTL